MHGTVSPRLINRFESLSEIFRIKMELMERQLEALTDLVKELTQSQQPKPNKLNQWIDTNTKTLYQQLKDLKMKAHSLRDDLSDIRRMQHSLQETFQNELEQANRKIEVS